MVVIVVVTSDVIGLQVVLAGVELEVVTVSILIVMVGSGSWRPSIGPWHSSVENIASQYHFGYLHFSTQQSAEQPQSSLSPSATLITVGLFSGVFQSYKKLGKMTKNETKPDLSTKSHSSSQITSLAGVSPEYLMYKLSSAPAMKVFSPELQNSCLSCHLFSISHRILK